MATQPVRIHIPKKDGTQEVARDLVREIRRGYQDVDEPTRAMVAALWERQGVLQGKQTQQQMLEIERAFQRYSPPVTRVYDAYIDAELAVDSPTTLTFRTPFAAIKYVRDTLGRTHVNLGWLKPSATFNPVVATETGNYSGANTVDVSIDLIGAEEYGSIRSSVTWDARWDLVTFTDGAKFNTISLRNIAVSSSIGSGNTPFQNASVQIAASNCSFSFGNARITSATSTIHLFTGCNFAGVSWGQASTPAPIVYADNCTFIGGGNETITQSLITRGCRFSNFAANALTGVAYVFAEASFQLYSSGSGGISGCSLLFNSANTNRIYISSVGEDTALDQGVSITISSTPEWVWVEGRIRTITLAAGSAQAEHHVAVQCETTFDITGPANIAVSSGLVGSFLRGEGIVGSAVCAANANAGVGLSFVGVKDSVILAVFQPYGTPAAGQAFTIDAASTHNTIITAGGQLLPTGSTNSSTTTIVVNDTAVFPVDLRDFEHEWIAGVQSGVTTIPAPAPGSAPTGPAGGSLASTYPNPTFAGRDNSVDQLNRDLLPTLLSPAPGVLQIPAPSTGGGLTQAAATDNARRDLIPALFTPPMGIVGNTFAPNTPAPILQTTAGTTPGSSGATNEGYRKALRSTVDKAQNSDIAVEMIDVVFNGFQITDGVIAGGSLNHLTSVAALFTAGMVGQRVICPGFVPAGTTVLTFNSTSDITLSANGTAGISLVVDINPTLKLTGLHVKAHTPRDNGGDTSAVLGVQTGGGGAGTFYQTTGIRPAGSIDYSAVTPQGAVEAFTDYGSQAIIAISGGQIFGAHSRRSAAVYARIDNSVSDGVIIAPNDAVMDKRIAWAVGNKNINAAPTNVQVKTLLDGTMETKGLLTAGGVAMDPSTDVARGVTVFPAVPDPRVLREKWLTPNAAPTFETFPRLQATANGAIVNGTIFLGAIALPSGWKISNLQLAVHTTGAAGPTHWWLALCDNAFVQLAVTADQLTGVLPSDFNQRIALAAPFTTTYEGVYYIAMMIAVATTMPTMFCSVAVTNNRLTGLTNPKLYLTGLTAQTVPQANGTNLAPVPGTTVAFPWLTAD